LNGFKPSNLVTGKQAISWAEIVSRWKKLTLLIKFKLTTDWLVIL
jgi:hypothetical protein